MNKPLIKDNTIDAREAKNHFGALLDAAQRRPVIILKHGRRAAVMLSDEQYKLFEQMEDYVWGKKAMAILKKNDFLGPRKSAAFLKSIVSNAHS